MKNEETSVFDIVIALLIFSAITVLIIAGAKNQQKEGDVKTVGEHMYVLTGSHPRFDQSWQHSPDCWCQQGNGIEKSAKPAQGE